MRPSTTPTCTHQRKRWTLRGQLQGVGFRPFIFRLASELSLSGFVRNDSSAVTIEAEGPAADLAVFAERLIAEKPALAQFSEVFAEEIAATGQDGFEISASEKDVIHAATVTADSAICPDCVRELFDPADFRYHYALINCTNCGPRFSIIQETPYDRIHTTMRHFALCEKCHQQYTSPVDRRFHAQPVACPECGPRVGLADFVSQSVNFSNPIAQAAKLLQGGKIVAIKGIGGFHLACRADRSGPVRELRSRKNRDAKPLAVMCANLDVAQRLVYLSAEAVREMTSPASPIVLAPARPTNEALRRLVTPEVAPGTDRLGVMIPYTPLHYLLFAELAGAGVSTLIMTSANRSDEPLVKGNEEAMARLEGIADAVLLHERDIERSIDDSVLIDMGPGQKLLPIRRARGYVPQVIRIHGGAQGAAASGSAMGLCVGGELKNTIAVVRGEEVILSHHLGDLKNTLAYEYFRKAIEDLCRLFEVRPQWIAHDLHPAYLSTQWAKALAANWNVPLIGVQHHHAHAAAVLAEQGFSGKALAVVCDGVGYGEDGSAWGGEIFEVSALGETMRRVAHLRPILLAGGDASARDTRRCAAGVLHELGVSANGLLAADEAAYVSAMLNSGRNCVRSSAAGRLFDAVAAMLGVCFENTHEAQAGMALEAMARSGNLESQKVAGRLHDRDGMLEIDLLEYVAELGERKQSGESEADLAAEFHEQFCQAMAAAVVEAAWRTGAKTVGLSGGVFCNEIVTKRTTALLKEAGLRVRRHEIVPPNDGGIAFGQAAIAMAKMAAIASPAWQCTEEKGMN